MMNKVIQTGRLVKDIELRYTHSGKAVANFTIAQKNRFKDNGEGVNYFDCIAWGKMAENMKKHVGKGCRITVAGRLQSDLYTKQDGTRVKKTEIVLEDVEFIDFNRDNQQQSGNDVGMYRPNQQPQQEDPFAGFGASIDISDDDLPF